MLLNGSALRRVPGPLSSHSEAEETLEEDHSPTKHLGMVCISTVSGPCSRDSSAPQRSDKVHKREAESVTASGDVGCDLREKSGSHQFLFRLRGYAWKQKVRYMHCYCRFRAMIFLSSPPPRSWVASRTSLAARFHFRPSSVAGDAFPESRFQRFRRVSVELQGTLSLLSHTCTY